MSKIKDKIIIWVILWAIFLSKFNSGKLVIHRDYFMCYADMGFKINDYNFLHNALLFLIF